MIEIYHHGIKGMRWGVRRYQNPDGSLTDAGKRRLGIDSKGNISLTKEKTTKENVAKFAVKTALFAAGMTLSIYISKHPEIVAKGSKMADDVLSKNGSKAVSDMASTVSNSGLYSKKLNRYLTIDEAIAEGLEAYITRR